MTTSSKAAVQGNMSEVASLENAWLEALHLQNVAMLNELLHDEFSSTPARCLGEVINKAEYVVAATEAQVCDYEIGDQMISEVGDIIVVKERLICHSKFQELDIHDDLLVTDVWIKVGDHWRAITRHASHLPRPMPSLN